MEQRPPRLGDIVDDYCPRERRITNHAIVATVEDAIRQTRCMTCDAEHVYKHAREPLRRRKDAPAVAPTIRSPAAPEATIEIVPPPAVAEADVLAAPDVEAVVAATDASAASPPEGAEPHPEDGWPAHRRLIRASLPRVEGEPPAPRPIPEFTMHQRPAGRGTNAFRFGRGGHGSGHSHGNGNAGGRGPQDGDRNGNRAPGDGGGRRHRRGHEKRSR